MSDLGVSEYFPCKDYQEKSHLILWWNIYLLWKRCEKRMALFHSKISYVGEKKAQSATLCQPDCLQNSAGQEEITLYWIGNKKDWMQGRPPLISMEQPVFSLLGSWHYDIYLFPILRPHFTRTVHSHEGDSDESGWKRCSRYFCLHSSEIN